MTDLGRMDKPALIFGGPYSNLEATLAVLAEAERREIPPERTICTGDIVACCADPQATIDAIRATGLPVVRGNCEESIGFDRDDCGCGFEEGSSCDLLSMQWFAYARSRVDDESKAWLRELPGRLDFEMAGLRFAVVHGAVSSINGFIFGSSPDEVVADELDRAGTDAVIGGHCGLPFVRRVGARLWLNAGVAGVPANDGTPRIWYAVLSPSPGGIDIELAPLEYDHAATAGKMRARGLANGYADALETGLLPSEGYLPAAERAHRGQPLQPVSLRWSADVLAD